MGTVLNTYIFIDIVILMGRRSVGNGSDVDGGRSVDGRGSMDRVDNGGGVGDVRRMSNGSGVDDWRRVVHGSLMVYGLVVTDDVLGRDSRCVVVQETSLTHGHQSASNHDLR